VPAGSFESAKDLTDRSIQIPILAGEPVVDAKLSPKGTPAGLVSRIPVGMRAYAIEVNEQTGVSGFVLPGHRIDIVQNKNASGSGQPEAELILQNLLVLASGQTFTKPEDKSIMSRTITLAVTPPQVDTLVAARSKGPLTLSLRGVNDNEVVAIPDPPRPKPVPEPAPAPPAEVALKALEPLPEPPRPVQPKRRSLTIVHGLQGTERISLEEMEDAAVVGGEQP
jgi:pilus assembly protein CpaB